jgi:hypothetical protein
LLSHTFLETPASALVPLVPAQQRFHNDGTLLSYLIHAMDKLPQELINRIVWFAERYPDQEKWHSAIGQSFKPDGAPSQFPRLAILNRTWKEAVETITFHHLGVKSDELGSLQSIVTGNRRKYLSWISFKAELPTYSGEAYEHKESRLDQHANNEAFTKAVSDLFTVLRTWEDNGVKNGVRLNIVGASSPTDFREVDELQIELGECRDIQSARWADSHLRLVQPENLPTLSNVQHLTIENSGGRRLAPSVAPNLGVALPELRTVDWEFPDCEADSDAGSDQDSLDSDFDPEWESATSPKARASARAEFANKLSMTHFRSLNSANIVLYHCTPSDQRYTVPSIVPEGYTYDPFSSSIRTFSQCLTTLTLSAHVDPTLFWPSDGNAIPPSWPHLKSLNITFDMVAPSGKWYFTGPTPAYDSDDDPEHGVIGSVDTREFSWADFRQHPDPETFDPFLGALAKAVTQMPVLESFMLTSDMVGKAGKLHISYHAPGQRAEWGDERPEDKDHRRIYYACETGVWVPEPQISEGLKRAGVQKYGGEAIERYVGSQYY